MQRVCCIARAGLPCSAINFYFILTSLDLSRLTLVKIQVLLYFALLESLQSYKKTTQLLLTGALIGVARESRFTLKYY
jgi:hypothetical protein